MPVLNGAVGAGQSQQSLNLALLNHLIIIHPFLFYRGANPNSQGEFLRSPLWRASFLGHPDVIFPLLNAGADPRVGNEQV